MAPHSSILAWRIPWTEEPARLQSTGSPRVRHDLATEHVHVHSADASCSRSAVELLEVEEAEQAPTALGR